MPPSPSTSPPRPRFLGELLRRLDAATFEIIRKKMDVKVDPKKRIDAPAQVARMLAHHPDLRDSGRLPADTLSLVHRIVESGGLLAVDGMPPGVDVAIERGLVFAFPAANGGQELVVPYAHMAQIRGVDAENPRCFRALVTRASHDAQLAIASYYLGRPATPPVPMALEAAMEAFATPARLEAEVASLSPAERRVIDGIEGEGGEVDTEELLELEREPIRLRTSTGATPSRRGIGFALERKGFVVPVHPGRHVIPAELSAVISRKSNVDKAAAREQVRTLVRAEDFAPRRAKFSLDPAPFAVGLVLATREAGVVLKGGVGTPKTLAARLSTRFGRDIDTTSMILALARAAGLFDTSARSPHSPVGALHLSELQGVLYAAWKRGGAWDEGRPAGELLRLPAGAREVSPAAVVRQMVCDALLDLGEGRWTPWSSLATFLESDRALPSLVRGFRRWAARAGVDDSNPLEVARRIAMTSLPALGMVDLGTEDDRFDDRNAAVTLRLSARGRAILSGSTQAVGTTPSAFEGTYTLTMGSDESVAHVLSLAPLVEVARTEATLDVVVTQATIARAVAGGLDLELFRKKLAEFAPVPDTLGATLAQANAVVGRGNLVKASGFLWVDDENVRLLLQSRKATQDLFLDPSPPGGLLVREEVDADRLVRRARSVGVEVTLNGAVLRARTLPAPAAEGGSFSPD
jgi:hypothetical protein